MNCIIRCICCAVLLIPTIPSQAATLVNGETLTFSSAAGSYVSGHWGGVQYIFDSANLDSLNGIVLGTAQPTVPGIDQTWTSNIYHMQGNEFTSSPVNVLSSSTLDFSGWVMRMNGGENYYLGSEQGIATYSSNGTTYTLDYYWTDAYNGGTPLGSLQVDDVHFHLVGTVSAVPIPGAIWLFGSGLLGLVSTARRKQRHA